MPTINLGGKKRARVPTTQKVQAQAIYQDKRWKIIRAEKLRISPLCEMCQAEERTTLAQEVHHIIPFSYGRNPAQVDGLAFDMDNLQSLCEPCHEQAHMKLRNLI